MQTLTARARQLREQDAGFAAWAAGWRGYPPQRQNSGAGRSAGRQNLLAAGHIADVGECYQALSALDRLTNQAMWLVVHMTYA